ncbi:MAG: methyltransferase domain-containing protein [Pseudomonadota bacterium]
MATPGRDESRGRRAAPGRFRGADAAARGPHAGCGLGSGHLVRAMALAVGSSGRALGVDLSDDQLAAAREHCADLPQAELLNADVCDLPLEAGAPVRRWLGWRHAAADSNLQRLVPRALPVVLGGQAGGRRLVVRIFWRK